MKWLKLQIRPETIIERISKDAGSKLAVWFGTKLKELFL